MGSKLAKKANFTKGFIDKLCSPSNNKQYDTYYDLQVSKLAVLVHLSGKKTFYVITKHNGKTEKLKLGAYPDLTVENARKKALEVLGGLTKDINPQDAKRTLRKEWTFKDAYKWFTEEYAPERKKQSSIAEDKALYRRYLADWDNKKLSSLTRETVAKKHGQIGTDNGKYAANRALALLSTIFNKAISNNRWNGSNPCQGVEKFKELSRERILLPKERERLFQALEAYSSQTAKDCLMMVALTGQRVSSVTSMKWDDVDLQDKVWCIPETKNGKILIVPLTSRAFEILNKRNKEAVGDYVFAGKSPKGHFSRLEAVFAYCLEKAKIKDLRIHDLRRSLGTSITESGANTFVVMKALGHESVEAAKVYNRPGVNAVRVFMEAAEQTIFEGFNKTENAA
jgi:integrase